MPSVNRFLPAGTAALFCFVPALRAVGAPQAAPPPAVVAPAVVIVAPVYDATAPLDATVSPLGGPGAPTQAASAIRTLRVRYRGARGAFVPGLLTLPPAQTGKRAPCVLLLHGLGGSKADTLLLGVLLARNGFASLALDAAGHGERPRYAGAGRPSTDLTLPQLRDLLATTTVDLRRAVDFVQTRPEIDSARVGYTGFSLGGIIGGLFVASEPRIKAGALWAAGGDWGLLLTTSQYGFGNQTAAQKARGEYGPDARAKLEAALADVDPARVIARATGRPLLFLNGTDDPIVPRACADALFNAAGQPKKRVLIPGGHIPDLAALTQETVQFLKTRL